MPRFNKFIAGAAAASLMAALGAAWAQNEVDPAGANAQGVTVTTPASGNPSIYFFQDQGNSPETDPAAHLLLINHDAPMPVARAETTTTVAQADTTVAPEPTPAPVQDTTTTTTTDTTDMSSTTDNSPALAPRADRN